jgi:hypothetical protein
MMISVCLKEGSMSRYAWGSSLGTGLSDDDDDDYDDDGDGQ